MPERDEEFNQMDTWRLFAILVLDYKRRIWDALTPEQQVARGRKARDEIAERLDEGRE